MNIFYDLQNKKITTTTTKKDAKEAKTKNQKPKKNGTIIKRKKSTFDKEE